MSPACSLRAPGSGGSGFASPQGGSTGSTETLRQVEPTWGQDPYHGTIPQKNKHPGSIFTYYVTMCRTCLFPRAQLSVLRHKHVFKKYLHFWVGIVVQKDSESECKNLAAKPSWPGLLTLQLHWHFPSAGASSLKSDSPQLLGLPLWQMLAVAERLLAWKTRHELVK